MAINTLGVGRQIVRPGGTYRLTANATLVNSYSQWQIGIGDGVPGHDNQVSVWKPIICDPDCDPISSINKTFTLPSDAKAMWPLIQSYGGTSVTDFNIELLPTFYRVSEKKIYAAPDADPYIFRYNYNYPAMNDGEHSLSALNCLPDTSCKEYSGEYSEFRGHGIVTVTGPDGRITETIYWQDDELKGRPKQVNVKSVDTLLRSTLFTYVVSTPLPEMKPLTTFNAAQTYVGVKRLFIYTSMQEERMYDSADNYSNTITTYQYNDSYGNLTHKEESANGVLYRKTDIFYYPKVSATRYLVSLPGKVKVYDAADAEIATTLYLYDLDLNPPVYENPFDHQNPPINGRLSAVRTLTGTDNNKYTQVSYEYDDWGNQTLVTNHNEYIGWNYGMYPANEQTTLTEYDNFGYYTYPTKITNAKGQYTTLAYDYTLGLPTSETANDATTSANYDNFGRMTSLTRPYGSQNQPSIIFEYPLDPAKYPYEASLTLRVDTGTTYTLKRAYDGMGRQIWTDAAGVRTDFTYDAYGRVLTQSMPYDYPGASPSAWTSMTYDVLGRLKTVTPPDNNGTSYIYNGLSTTVTEPDTIADATHTTTTTTDAWGRTIRVTPPTGPSVSYTYDELDRLKTVLRGGLTTKLNYDFGGRKISMSDPDMGDWTYEYDALGNLKTQTDERNCKLTMDYDTLNRLTRKYSNGAVGCGAQVDTRYAYDAGPNDPGGSVGGVGRRTSMTDASGSTRWEYDLRGRLTKEIKDISGAPSSFTTSREYNLADLLVKTTYPGDNEQVIQTYDSKMLLKSLSSGLNSYVNDTNYDNSGRITKRVYGNNTQTDYFYNPWNEQGGRLQKIVSSRQVDAATNHVFQSLIYIYDNAGNVQAIQNEKAGIGENQSYEYDELNRLEKWYLGGVLRESYAYNPDTGNLDSKTKDGVTSGYTYDLITYDVNNVNSGLKNHAVTAFGNSGNFQYDPNGNMEQRTINGATANMYYDAEGHLINVTGNVASSPLTPGPSPTPVAATPTVTIPPTATKTFTPTFTKTVTPSRTLTPIPTSTPAPIFADVPYGHPYKDYIEALYNAHITSGCSVTPLNYCPLGNLTRAEMAMLILKSIHGSGYTPPLVGASTGFADVPTDHLYAAWIKQLAAEGITGGCSTATPPTLPNYCPNNPVTRAQMAIFLLRAEHGSSYSPPAATGIFTDVPVGYWADKWVDQLAIELAVKGVTSDCGTAHYYCPDANITRQVIAAFFVSVFNIPLAYEPGQSLAAIPQAAPSAYDAFTSMLARSSVPPLPAYLSLKVLAAPVKQSGNTATPAPDNIFSNGFESGNLSSWSSAITDGSNLSVTTQSAAVGQYGLKATANGVNAMYVRDSTPVLLKYYRSRFYFNPNSFNMTTGDRVIIFASSNSNFRLLLKYTASGYWLETEVKDDAGVYQGGGSHYITNDWQAVEYEWKAASAAGANDGYLNMWLNNTQVEARSGFDNDTHSIDYVSLGFYGSLDAGMSGTLYFDDFVSQSLNYIGLNQNGPLLTAPQNPPDLIMADGFESGDFSRWSSSNTDLGDLSVTSAASHQSSFGMQTVIDDTNSIYVSDASPLNTPHYRARFYLDPNSLTMTNGNSHDTVVGYNQDHSDSIFRIRFYKSSNLYKLQTIIKNDSVTNVYSSQYTISDDWNVVEIEWQAASAPGANNGFISLWIDDTLAETISNVDNDTIIAGYVNLGAVSNVDTTTSGTMYFDHFESRRNSYIGPLQPVATVTPTSITTPTATATATKTFTPSPTATRTPTATLTSTANVFTPMDDAYIESGFPTTNYSSATTLQVDNSPIKHFLIKFNVTGVNGQQVTNAKIRLYSVGTSNKGGDFYRVSDNTWQEETVTWDTKPAADTTLLASLGAVSPNTWYEVDVTSLVTGDGTYSLLISSTSTDGADYSSKEGANDPQLVVTLGGTPSSTPAPTDTPTATPAASDLIFADDFESGNFSAWSSANTGGGNLSVSASAALVGSAGLQSVISGATTMYAQDDSPNAEPRYRARFYFDPNSLVMTSGDYQYILVGFANSTNTAVLRVAFKNTSGVYQLNARILNDSAVWQSTPYITISDAPHTIEVDWAAASAVGANDGYLTFWIDGIQQGSLVGIDDDSYRMERVRLGMTYSSATGTSGAYFFDAFESRRQTYIGPVTLPNSTPTSIPTGIKTPTPAATQTEPTATVTSTSTTTPIVTSTVTSTKTATATSTPTGTSTPTAAPTAIPTATVPPQPGSVNATFTYDGDGNRVKSTINGVTTYFVGNHYEVANGVVTKYYYAGSQRIAMRKNGTLTYMLSDHLGSTSLTTSDTGVVLSELRYTAWGEVRYQAGTTSTGYTYTGQYSNTADFGLMYYNARWYDPALGRFAQADSIVPGGVQGYDRYAYAYNSPVNYVDPSGHCGIEYDDNNQPTVGDLDCTAADIDKWSIKYRQQWFDLLTENYDGWFNNIEGILEAFNYTGTATPGTWASVTDAGILETIQNGRAVFEGYVDLETFGTEGSLRRDASGKWASFFQNYGKVADAKLKTLWGDAEVAGTDYGRDIAEKGLGLGPNENEQQFLWVGDWYRLVMGVQYGGEMIGAGMGGLKCGAGCAVTGWQVGGYATDPRSQFLGQAPVYWMAVIILGQ